MTGVEAAAWTRVWHNVQFRYLLLSRGISVFGDAVLVVAVPFAVLAIGGSVADVGLVLGVEATVTMLSYAVSGVIADRYPRRAALLASDLLQGVVIAALAVLLWSGSAEVWHLAALMVPFGATSSLNGPATSGLLPEIVESDELQPANGLLAAVQNVAQIAGPALAGAILVLGDAALAVAIDAATFFVALGLVALMKPTPEPDGETQSMFAELKEGVGEALARRWYWTTVIAHAFWNAGLAIFLVVGPTSLASREGGPAVWGVMGASMAAGGVLGGLLLLRLQVRRPLLVANLAGVPGALSLLALIGPSPVVLLVMTAGIMGVGTSLLNGLWRSAVQQMIPARLIGRVTSLDWMLSVAVMPVGYFVAGRYTDSWGMAGVLAVGAAAMALPLALTATIPTIRQRVEPGE